MMHLTLRRQVNQESLLQECLRFLEQRQLTVDHAIALDDLLPRRSWSRKQLLSRCQRAIRNGTLQPLSDHRFQLTTAGYQDSLRIVRNERLWETYLIRHADVAGSLVDRHAHSIDDVLDAHIIDELEATLSDAPANSPKAQS